MKSPLGDEVDTSSANQSGELESHLHELEPRRAARLELDDDIHVALGPEIVSEGRAEEGQLPDVVSLTERRECNVIDRKA